MEKKEHEIICKSLILRIIFSVIASCGFVFLSHFDYIFFGTGVTLLISFPFAFILSGKFFPDSCEFYSHRHKNFLRLRKGLAPKENSHPIKGHYYDDFMRG